jgi:hypothetical protein
VIGLALLASGCGAHAAVAASGTVFDPAGASATAAPVDTALHPEIEHPLGGVATNGGGWVAVSLLQGGVHLERPAGWTVREASLDPDHRYVRYVSPRAYSFAIYERNDSPGGSWHDLLDRYEADLAACEATAIGARIPVASWRNQGFAYTVDRKIDGPDAVLSRSREVLLRGDHRVVLVQIVTSEADLSGISDEVLQLLRHLEVL